MQQQATPIPVPDRLPSRLTPCPIVEAAFELRFVTTEMWSTLPGLLYAAIRDRYPEKRDLPLAQIPEMVRVQDPRLATQPLIRFEGAGPFAVLCGPRVVALVTQPDRYPGWAVAAAELGWLVPAVLAAGVIHEPERLEVRYIDFFAREIFPELRLGVAIDNDLLSGGELQFVTTLSQWAPFTARLFVSNAAIVTTLDGQARRGSVLDVAVGLGALDLERQPDALLARFGKAHQINKQAFFGLLKPAFLATLNPEYANDADA